MTTPQSILYELSYKFDVINKLITGDEDENGILERVDQIESQNDDIVIALQRIENQLGLIIRVLAKCNDG